MTAPPRRAEINQYGLPLWIGGWARPDVASGSVSVRAVLDGREIAATDAIAGDDGRAAFAITFATPLQPGFIVSGRLCFFVRFGDEAEEPIPCWEVLTAVDGIADTMAALTRWKSSVGTDFASICTNLPKMFPDIIAPLVPPPGFVVSATAEAAAHDGGSPVHLPVGLVSRTGDAVLGRKGFVFAGRGTDGLFHGYRVAVGDPGLSGLAEAWKALAWGRLAAAGERGIGFVQTIVPDKASVLPDHLPSGVVLTPPTPLLAAVEQRMRAAILQNHYVSGLDVLKADDARVQVFRRVDTHLTPFGAFRLAKALARQLGHPIAAGGAFGRVAFAAADLGDRFFDVPVLDQINEAVMSGPQPQTIEDIVPRADEPVARRQMWRQPDAPIGKRLIIFGDSFCNVGEAGQGFLSHWLVRWFAEVHIVWSPTCDWAFVDAVRADLVLCQTAERALGGEVPAT